MTKAAKPLNILCWAGYDAPHFVKGFEQRWDCTVFGQAYDSDVEAASKIIEESHWDIININNPYVNSTLYPEGRIESIDGMGFHHEASRLLPCLKDFLSCTHTLDGTQQIGLCQRFGPFNLVIDHHQIDVSTARDEGFSLADDVGNKGKFGVLLYPEFNVMHAAIACGINPFNALSAPEQAQVVHRLKQWTDSALLCTSDHNELNQALIDGEIRFYISGGVYTAGVARRAGHLNIMSATPNSGPINGKGGVAFVEVTSVCAGSSNTDLACQYLHYMVEPEQCHRIAFAEGVHNPVAQMGDTDVMAKFSTEDLKALQFSTLDEDMERCAPYASIPSFKQIRSASGII